MAKNSISRPSGKKKPVNQKRTAIVLACLVGTLTLSSGILLIMERGPLGAPPPPAFATDRISIEPSAPLKRGAWNYIIIYESGDPTACAASLADGNAKGVPANATHVARPGANFHFVVDSSCSKDGALDGELEVGPSWLNQDYGTPYAGWPDPRYHTYPSYKNAIGVCVSGDLANKPYSDGQFRNLIDLTKKLQQRLAISKDAIKFQWELAPNDAHATEAQKAFSKEFRQWLD